MKRTPYAGDVIRIGNDLTELLIVSEERVFTDTLAYVFNTVEYNEDAAMPVNFTSYQISHTNSIVGPIHVALLNIHHLKHVKFKQTPNGYIVTRVMK